MDFRYRTQRTENAHSYRVYKKHLAISRITSSLKAIYQHVWYQMIAMELGIHLTPAVLQ
jgi:hypothetical protein